MRPALTVRVRLTFGILAGVAVLCSTQSVRAMPMFSRRYDLPCAKCHSMMPRLNNFGYAFYKAGFHLFNAEVKPPTLPNIGSFLADFRLQNTNPHGDTGFDIASAELQLAAAIDPHVSSRLQYSFSSQTDAASGFNEAWLRYNSGIKASYWTALIGQIPVLDGFKLAGVSNRDITLSAPLIFGNNGPFPLMDADPRVAVSLNGLQRGVEVGYNRGSFNGRVSLLNGVNEAGQGDRSLTGQGRRLHDTVGQAEYLIGNQGSSLSAFYYHGQTPVHDPAANSVHYDNTFYRAGAFGSYGHILKPGPRGIPDLSMDLNLGYISGDDKISVTGTRAMSSGGIVELDLYQKNRSALVGRYDFARPSDAGSISTTKAYTIAFAHRPADYCRYEIEYRNQSAPGANSVIASLWFFY